MILFRVHLPSITLNNCNIVSAEFVDLIKTTESFKPLQYGGIFGQNRFTGNAGK